MLLDTLNTKKIKVYAFVGPSGTGKSYRAQMVASEKGVNFIIDDGLLIKDNEVIAGESAKKAATKIETVKHALFLNEKEQEEMHKAFRKYKPKQYFNFRYIRWNGRKNCKKFRITKCFRNCLYK